jgi:drug/metabolite transporter (DMT)-like permease
MKPLVGILAFAVLASLGNAIFVYGNRKAGDAANPFIYIMGGLIVAAVLLGLLSPLMPGSASETIRRQGVWMVVTGVGTVITFVGFFYLFGRYGAAQYAVYAMLSLIVTSIGVGAVIFKEQVNLWHGGAILFALISLGLFFKGQQVVVKKQDQTQVSETQ